MSKNRWMKGMVMLFALVCMLVGMKQQLQAKGKNQSTPILHEHTILYKGETRFLDIKNMGGEAKVSIKTTDPGVVKVFNNGKMKAKQCGKTVVAITMSLRQKKMKVKLIVEVRKSNTYHSDSFTTETKAKKSNHKMPLFQWHEKMKPNERKALSFSNIRDAKSVTFSSTNEQIASVRKNGVIIAKKKGRAKIKTSIRYQNRVYEYVHIIHVSSERQKVSYSAKQRDEFFSQSGFIGSSIGVGQRMYFHSQGEGYLGNPVMMVKGCYSFYNDKSDSKEYKVTYNGVPYMAKDAIAKSGVKYAFINMGTNDLWMEPKDAYKEYVQYLEGIRKKNPKVILFIESTTPVREEKSGHLTNKNVDTLNRLMKGYCKKQKDIYYIDVTSCLRDADGRLADSYCSDGFVHLSMKAYEKWMEEVCRFVRQLQIQQMLAKEAVETVEESHNRTQYRWALNRVKRLEKSRVKSKLMKRLKRAI